MVVVLLLFVLVWVECFVLIGMFGVFYYVVMFIEDVYVYVYEVSLVDLCIFNGDGELVLFIIDILCDLLLQVCMLYDVYWFVMFIDDVQKLGVVGVVFGIDGVLCVMGVQLLQVFVCVWVVDFSQFCDMVMVLIVVLLVVEFQSGVSVQVSDDLQYWSLVVQVMLFCLFNQGSMLVQDCIEFMGLWVKYLCLMWQGKLFVLDVVCVELVVGALVVFVDNVIQWCLGLVLV